MKNDNDFSFIALYLFISLAFVFIIVIMLMIGKEAGRNEMKQVNISSNPLVIEYKVIEDGKVEFKLKEDK